MGSDSGSSKSGSKKDSGANFFDNFSEDLGNVLSGKGSGPHSAYDVRNAKAMAIKTGQKQKHFLPGGAYGPGGGSYSPSTLHEAGVRQQKALDAERVANEKIRAQRSKTSAIVAARKMDAQRALKSQADIPGPMTRTKDDPVRDGQVRDGQVNEAVGPFGKNRPDDIKSLQRALATTKDFDIAVTGEADGLPGQRLLGAVENFQNRNGLKVDGIVMPNGPTATALSQTVGGAPVATTRPAKPFGEPQAPGELVPQQGNLPKGNVAISPSAEAANLKRQMDDKKKAEDAARKQAEQRTRQNAMDYEAQAYNVGAPATAQPISTAQRQNAMDYEAQAYNVGAPAASQLPQKLTPFLSIPSNVAMELQDQFRPGVTPAKPEEEIQVAAAPLAAPVVYEGLVGLLAAISAYMAAQQMQKAPPVAPTPPNMPPDLPEVRPETYPVDPNAPYGTTTTYPAQPPSMPNILDNTPPEVDVPDVIEARPLAKPNHLTVGEKPSPHLQSKLDQIQDDRIRKAIKDLVQSSGTETHGDRKHTDIDADILGLSAAQRNVRNIARELGIPESQIVHDQTLKGGRVDVLELPSGVKITAREFSTNKQKGDRPTTEIQLGDQKMIKIRH